MSCMFRAVHNLRTAGAHSDFRGQKTGEEKSLTAIKSSMVFKKPVRSGQSVWNPSKSWSIAMKNLQDSGNKEISAMTVGESVVRELAQLDGVAYVRFASVYREFKDVNEFMSELKDILKNKDS